MSSTSLRQFIPTEYLITQHIEEGKQEIIKSKKKILTIAEEYNQRHRTEILEGTKKRQLMLSENVGRKEEDVLAEYGKFIPSVYTPILNFLYFFINEGYDTEQELEREIQDKKYGNLFEDIKYNCVEEPVEMEQFIYGNCTHKTFQTIKKLKRLSRSISNENEASAAYIACMKMCEKHNLDFDRVPLT